MRPAGYWLGFVYFMQAADGNIKIGFTKNVGKRLAQARTFSPGLRLLGSLQTASAASGSLQRRALLGFIERAAVIDRVFRFPRSLHVPTPGRDRDLQRITGGSMSRACGKDHSGEVPRAVGDLPDSQAGFWRHRCAGCAYLLGRTHAAEAEQRLRDRIAGLERKLAEARS